MNEFFAKLKSLFKTTRNTTASTAGPAVISINPSSSEQGSNRSAINSKHWIPGALSIATVASLLFVLAFHLQLARQNALQIELTIRLQEHTQHLPVIIQQIFAGNENAFEQLKNSREAIDQSIALLSQGGYVRQHYISPVTEKSQLDPLETIANNWMIEDKKIQFIFSSRQTFTRLGQAIGAINATGNLINQNIEQLISHMTQTGSSPGQLSVISTMRTLIQNVFRSINVILPSKLPATEIQNQLAHDRKQFSAIISALNEGRGVLQFSAPDGSESQEKLQQIKSLFITIDTNIETIQSEIAAIMPARTAANQLIQNNEIMRNSITALDYALQSRDTETTVLLQKIMYILIACSIISLCWLIYAWRRYKTDRSGVTVHGLDKTQEAMLRLLDDMRKIAEGDLTVRTAVTEDITGAIADAVNFTIEELHTLVEQVNIASLNVVAASGQAQQNASELLAAARQQSQKIKEATMTMVGMAEAINNVSDTARESTQIAGQSLEAAEKGGIAVRQAITGMEEIRAHIQDTAKRVKRLGESAQEISEIVELVSDIAEQTNVLALNAALQASAAGEAGRGFTIIAQDVQRLAERSAEASKQISRLIKMIQNDTYDAIVAMERSTLGVAQGTQRSHATGKALEEIETVSKQLAQQVTHIYDTTHAQTQAANTVIENMEKILLITQQTTDGSLATSTAIKHITGYAAELKSSVSSFKV
ncbi:MAG: methyl-accepting chemotaxis protein [Nitrosomonas sp.]|nr:methyl-accepting chemotaxis protein [Nitrosomonas sp.]